MEALEMNWVDIILLVFLVIQTLVGLWQGLVKSLLNLAGIVIGVVLASNFYKPLADAMGFISNREIANIVAFVIILVVVIIIALILARIIKALLKMVMLGWVNHLGGAVFGFLMGAVIAGAMLATWVKFFGSDILAGSLIAGILLDKFPLILSLLPKEFDMVRDFFK